MQMLIDPALIIPNPNLSILEGGITASGWGNVRGDTISKMYFDALAKRYHFKLTDPIKDIPPKGLDAILYGTRGEPLELRYERAEGFGIIRREFEGIVTNLERRYRETQSPAMRADIEECMSETPCPECQGRRLKKTALAVTVGGLNIAQFTDLSVGNALDFINGLVLNEKESLIAAQILKEIRARLGFLQSVGLGYLTLSRMAATLSGGESQRIRLATQIGSSLMGVLYILDEPSIGLHQRDNAKLLKTLRQLRDLGNTLIVVEHDEETMRAADYVVDIGPGAGLNGGRVVCAGSIEDICACEESVTGQYLSGKKTIPVPGTRRLGNGKSLWIRGAREDAVDKVIALDQSPIGRTPRSNPATYTGAFNEIRDLFASTQDARLRGYGQGRFSFNVKGGRCEACSGDGLVKIEMHFLPDVYVPCDVCGGKRYNRETLEVRYKGKNIADVLDMTVEEACSFFANQQKILNKIQTLYDVGLGYVKLGQSSTTLSGGEAQRVKLATELSKRSTGSTVYVLDEPTTGLHVADVHKLIDILNRLTDAGNTVVVIEHNLDVIKVADHIIDLGPEGGDAGGNLVFAGTPEDCARCESSFTGQFLRPLLECAGEAL